MADKKNVWVGGLILSCLIAVVGFGSLWILSFSYLLLGLPIVVAIIRGVCCFKFQKKYIVVNFLTSVIVSLAFCFMGWIGLVYGLVYAVISIFAVIGVIKENRQQNAIIAVSMLFTIVLLLIFSLIAWIAWGELPFGLIFVILIISDLAVLYKFGLDEFMGLERIKSLSKAVVVKKMYFSENSLEALKEAYEKGEISEEEYDRRKTEIMNSL